MGAALKSTVGWALALESHHRVSAVVKWHKRPEGSNMRYFHPGFFWKHIVSSIRLNIR